jgi:hypothetical protein
LFLFQLFDDLNLPERITSIDFFEHADDEHTIADINRNTEISEMIHEYFEDTTFQDFIFLNCVFYLDHHDPIQTPDQTRGCQGSLLDEFYIEGSILLTHGGIAINCIHEKTTHIITSKPRLEQLNTVVHRLGRCLKNRIYIVSRQWIHACIAAKTRVDELQYVV